MSQPPAYDDLLNIPYVAGLVKKYVKPATLLFPKRSATAIPISASKFGGEANMAGFSSYPCCDACGTPLNFVLQLYKRDFLDFYFPGDTDLFQLYRCPNTDCPGAYADDLQYDQKMFIWYFTAEDLAVKSIAKPALLSGNMEQPVPDCELKPTIDEDLPNYDDLVEEDLATIEKQLSAEVQDELMDKFAAAGYTKFGGYPSYTQSPNYPECTCGKTKEFFFQLSSSDGFGDYAAEKHDMEAAHGIMIGDLGNIYFYVCKDCGPGTIESNWDCG